MGQFGGFNYPMGETTNKVAETKDYDKKRKEARKAIKAEKRGSDSRKEKRFAASKLAREERKARANDRKQAWAEKQVAKGKYENKEAAMARFDALREMTTKSVEIRDNIVNSRPTESIEAEEQTQNDVNDTTYIPPMPVVDDKKIGSNITPGQLN